MPTGRALVVGLREVNPASYNGNSYSAGVEGAEFDVDRIAKLLGEGGFGEICTLKTRQATADAILGGLRRGAAATQSEDLFVFYCAGHGDQLPDDPNAPDEADGLDEEFCAYDRPVKDDEFGAIWRSFRPGARIVMIADCCHSGTLYTLLGTKNFELTSKMMTMAEINPMVARLLHLAAVPDDQRSLGFDGGGLFTIELAKAWQDGQFVGTYEQLFAIASTEMQGLQACVLNTFGPNAETVQGMSAFRP